MRSRMSAFDPKRTFGSAMRLAPVLLLFTVFGVAPSSLAAGFDCTRATTRIERMICADEELTRLDDILTAEYADRVSSPAIADAIRSAQRSWLTSRNICRDRSCVLESYVTRIREIRSCRIGLDGCESVEPEPLPKTVEGRLMLLTREECRIGGKKGVDLGSEHAMRTQADCIEAGVYDPCEDAGSRSTEAQCAWVNLEVAQRRIRRAEAALMMLVSGWGDQGPRKLPNELTAATTRWASAQDAFCREQDRLDDNAPATSDEYEERRAAGETNFGEKFGFCIRRTVEERASKLEDLVRTLEAAKTDRDRRPLQGFLAEKPQFTPR